MNERKSEINGKNFNLKFPLLDLPLSFYPQVFSQIFQCDLVSLCGGLQEITFKFTEAKRFDSFFGFSISTTLNLNNNIQYGRERKSVKVFVENDERQRRGASA